MTKKGPNINDELIAKYLAGEAHADEQQEVESWLDASEANRQEFSRIRSLWERTGRVTSHEEVNVDVDRAWMQFKDKANAQRLRPKSAEKSKSRILFPHWVRIAAALVIGLALYLIFPYFNTEPGQEGILLTASEVRTDTLSDGSVITLNARGQLVFPKEFIGNKRLVTLKGEAFFTVRPDPAKPFVVKTKGVTITVLGTSFHVEAYDSLNKVEVGVEEGTVKVTGDNAEAVLNGGERISVNARTGEMTATTPYNPNVVYWKSKTLTFRNEPLAGVFKAIRSNYGVEIEVKNQRILDCRLSGKFHDEPVSRIFEIIDTNFDLTSEKKAGRFIVSGDGCN